MSMVRDRAFVSNKYEDIWGKVRDYVRFKIEGKSITLPEIMRLATLFTLDLQRSGACLPKEGRLHSLYLGNVRAEVPSFERAQILRIMGAATVLRALREDCDAIAELGAGWSANLFTLWLLGAPPSARYFGCELTAAGREAAVAIASTEPRMRFSPHAFDWDEPDYAFLAGSRHVTVFSKYSMEQIPHLKRSVFDRLLEHTRQAESVQGVHIEPFGWQYPERSLPEFVAAGRPYAEALGYNLNGRALFEELARDGIIKIESVAVDVFSYDRNNPATIIHWSRP